MNWSSIRRTLLLLAVTGALALPAAAELPVQAPLPYNGEFVEVTAANTLRNRYASLDFAKDMAFYLDQATKAAAKTGKTGSMTIKQVLIREIFLVDDAGKPLAVCKLPEGFFTQIAEHEKAFADFVFSSSNGAMKVKFAPAEIVDKVNYTVGKLGANWWFNPKNLHEANPIDNPKGIISPEYGGKAYGSEEMAGARLNTLNDHEIARSVHEWQHHIFDTTIQETEHITVTRGHGLIDAGYAWNALTWGPKFGTLNVGPCLAYYRDCNRYYNRRDMWLRWRLRPAHNIPHEPFSGKAYAWADVTDDMWFKLPQLDSAALRALTGLPMIRVNAPDSALVLDVGTGEGLLSPMLAGEIKTDTTLNNAVNFFEESAAYLRTPTGQWVFVKPQIADVYVDMLALRGKAAKPLVVYGYILEGCKALVAIKLPDDLPVPTDEVSFFRPLPLTVKADGLIAPDDYRFNKSLPIEFGGTPAGASVHYTLDGSDPTEKSPLAKGPIALTDTTTVKARVLGGPADLPYWAKTFVFQPFTAETDGLVKGAGTSFATKAVVRFKTSVAGGAVRYALDGSAPNDKSPAYSAPIEMVKTTTVTARYFDAANKPLGYTWATTFSERNLALSKPVEASGNKNPGERPEFAVDGSTDIGQYWGTIPAPQWIRVDLEKEYSIDRIHIWPYWDGGRYYQYTIEVSTDDKTWTQVVDASKASTPETDKGHLHVIKPTPARYVKVTMLKNSDNPAIHLVELQVFEAPK
ncbi:MAG: chitobiase/beta-hexosaminidase C-terminal domain-containing protein [Planctomycetota bacterium]|nr:chitobiase/beta-hexosaminidase C-terminal domain-containing protein [Planctomycetota bacterium]